jgi:competence protein ComEA
MSGEFSKRGLDFHNPAHQKKLLIAIVMVVVALIAVFHYVGNPAPEGDLVAMERMEAEGQGADESGDAEKGAVSDGNGGSEQGNSVAEGGGTAVGGTIYVDVAGAVLAPQVTALPAGSRVYEAIAAAGGLSKEADTKPVNQATVLQDGDRVYIPTKKEAKAGQMPAENAAVTGGTAGTADALNSDSGQGKVNINTADATGLQQLTGVGPATAQKIIDYRTQKGTFRTIEDLKNVSGIGPKTFEKMKDRITV